MDGALISVLMSTETGLFRALCYLVESVVLSCCECDASLLSAGLAGGWRFIVRLGSFGQKV